MGTNTGSDEHSRRTKVERVLDEYDLDEFGQRMARYWTGDAEERFSLRELATLLNKRLLEVAMQQADMTTLDGEVENYYRLLSSETVSAGERTEAKARLETAGVDVDQLETDFVSHQAIHTYLTETRDVAHESTAPDEQLENSLETLRRLEGRVETVAETVIEGAESTDLLDIGEYDVLASVTVLCRSCGKQYPATELLERGHCGCVSAGQT